MCRWPVVLFSSSNHTLPIFSSGRSWLVNLEASMGRENLILTVFPMKVQLKIQGPAVIIREAMRRIEDYLHDWFGCYQFSSVNYALSDLLLLDLIRKLM